MIVFEKMEQIIYLLHLLIVSDSLLNDLIACLVELETMRIDLHLLVDVKPVQYCFHIYFTGFVKFDMLMPWDLLTVNGCRISNLFQCCEKPLQDLLFYSSFEILATWEHILFLLSWVLHSLLNLGYIWPFKTEGLASDHLPEHLFGFRIDEVILIEVICLAIFFKSLLLELLDHLISIPFNVFSVNGREHINGPIDSFVLDLLGRVPLFLPFIPLLVQFHNVLLLRVLI